MEQHREIFPILSNAYDMKNNDEITNKYFNSCFSIKQYYVNPLFKIWIIYLYIHIKNIDVNKRRGLGRFNPS